MNNLLIFLFFFAIHLAHADWQEIPNKPAQIDAITRKGNNEGPKLIGLILNQPSGTTQAFQQFLESVARKIYDLDTPEKKKNKIKYTSFELVALRTNKPKDIAHVVAALHQQNSGITHRIVALAYGADAHTVNLATHLIPKAQAIDTLIYIQSPVYEWSWNIFRQRYEHNKQWSPHNFRRLYNFYTMADHPALNRITYPDRTYRQQAVVKNEYIYSPVKNLRLLKANEQNILVDVARSDLDKPDFINHLAGLIKYMERWSVNFDFYGSALDESNAFALQHFELLEKDLEKMPPSWLNQQRPQPFRPAVTINNYVQLRKDGNLWIRYGENNDQEYIVMHGPISKEIIQALEKHFFNYIRVSALGLHTLLDHGISHQLHTDFVRLKKQSIQMLASRDPLYAHPFSYPTNISSEQLSSKLPFSSATSSRML